MTRTTRLLLLALCLVAAAALLFFSHRQTARPASATSAPWDATRKMSADFAAAYEKMRAADKIEDVGQRCLSYPDPEWLHWDREVVTAFCRSRSFGHLKLEDIKAALDENHSERLQEAFASYLSDNYSDPAKRGILTRAYRELFASSAPEVRDVVKRWVNADPQSAFALAARGTYYKSAAEAARGGEYAKDTPGESFETMDRLMAKARRDLEVSLKMSPRLMAAYDALILVGMQTSDRALIAKSVEGGLALDPADERIYLDWMQASQPRWGGSLDEMAHVDQVAQQHAAANPLLKLVTEKKLAHYGDLEIDRRNYAAALERFEDAFKVAPSPLDLGRAGYAASMLGQHEKAIWYFSQAFRFDQFDSDSVSRRAYELKQLQRPALAAESLALAAPHKMPSAAGLVSTGDAYWNLGQFEAAANEYEAALKVNPRDEFALIQLASVYIGPMKTPAKAQSLVDELQKYYPDHAHTWYLVAALADKDDARCLAALKRYMALVDPDDPGESSNIGYAKAAIARHEGNAAHE
jgi:tetratricopeptide (TPR) repeat protein